MAVLLELKEKIKRIYGKYGTYIVPAAKFLLTLIAMLMMTSSIGYVSPLKSPVISILLAVICAFLPAGFMVVSLSLVLVLHLYSISAEFAAVTLCLVIIMYLLYFRLAPKTGYLLVITSMLCWMKLPYLAPIALGLTVGAPAVVPVGFGIVIYYIIKTASEYEAAITGQTASNTVQKFTFIIDGFLNNKDMLLLLFVLLVTIIIVSIIRKMAIDNAWNVAIIAGALVEFVFVIVGKLALSAGLNIIIAILGILISAVIAYICEILFFNLDYKRTEFVQYEDDEYYYYVKAVPKVNLVNEDLKVKRINAQKARKTDDINSRRKADTRQMPKPSKRDFEDGDNDGITFDK
ncbi:MAG: hypothetical protein PUE71_00630 [Clostridia bacterium]|nr:hypothetical protein [Clostridia bacterium]